MMIILHNMVVHEQLEEGGSPWGDTGAFADDEDIVDVNAVLIRQKNRLGLLLQNGIILLPTTIKCNLK